MNRPVLAALPSAVEAVDMTNDGSSPCSMDGFPGTNLAGTAVGPKNHSKQDYAWPLTRASRSYSTVTATHPGTYITPVAPGA